MYTHIHRTWCAICVEDTGRRRPLKVNKKLTIIAIVHTAKKASYIYKKIN